MKRTDEQIKKDIVDHLAWDSRVDASKVKVEVHRGKAVLSGTVLSYPSRQIAHRDALSVEGVLDIENNIEVAHGSPKPSDDELRDHIRTILRELSCLDMDAIEISVEDGVVTLKGPCRSYWTRQRAEDLASLVPGVSDIRNALSVVPRESLSDDAVAKSILAALQRNSEVDERSVSVMVENGGVTLMGTVPTWHDRELVYNTALCTEGVVHIDDRLFVVAPAPGKDPSGHPV